MIIKSIRKQDVEDEFSPTVVIEFEGNDVSTTRVVKLSPRGWTPTLDNWLVNLNDMCVGKSLDYFDAVASLGSSPCNLGHIDVKAINEAMKDMSDTEKEEYLSNYNCRIFTFGVAGYEVPYDLLGSKIWIKSVTQGQLPLSRAWRSKRESVDSLHNRVSGKDVAVSDDEFIDNLRQGVVSTKLIDIIAWMNNPRLVIDEHGLLTIVATPTLDCIESLSNQGYDILPVRLKALCTNTGMNSPFMTKQVMAGTFAAPHKDIILATAGGDSEVFIDSGSVSYQHTVTAEELENLSIEDFNSSKCWNNSVLFLSRCVK